MTKSLVAALFISMLFLQFAQAETLDVRVNNFPETQQVKGAVSIDGTTSHAKSFKKEGIVVPTSRRNEPSELVFAGVVETDGFTSVTINLQGEVKSGSFTPGAIGVLLIPDEEPVLRALREAKRIQFSIESAARLNSGDSSFFNAEQVQQRIAFSRYKIYLYNTTNRTAEANVYLYLSN